MKSDRHSLWLGLFMAFAGAIAFSGKAIVVKLLFRQGIAADAALALRMLLAWPVFIGMSWRGARHKPRLGRSDLVRVAILGVTGYYLASLLDFVGLQYISASLERLILYVYPTIVALIAVARGHENVTVARALAFAASYGGLLLAFGQEAALSLGQPGSHVALGSACVFGAAVSYAVYLVLSGETVRRLGALRLAGLASGIASALCVGQFCAFNPLNAWSQFSLQVWTLSLVNATVCTVLPIWMVMRAIELIGASRTAQIGMIGPVSTLILARCFLLEPLTAAKLLGTALLLVGVSLLARQKPPVAAAEVRGRITVAS